MKNFVKLSILVLGAAFLFTTPLVAKDRFCFSLNFNALTPPPAPPPPCYYPSYCYPPVFVPACPTPYQYQVMTPVPPAYPYYPCWP